MLILGLLLPMLLGLAICWLIIPDASIPVRFALAYSLGFGFLTLAMFFLNVFGVDFSLVNTVILVCGLIAILLAIRRKRNRWGLLSAIKVNPFAGIKQFMTSLSGFEKILLGLLIFFLLSHLVIAVYWPVLRSDSLTLYDLRAKYLFTEQSFPGAVAKFQGQLLRLQWTRHVFAHAPMTSLVHTWLYLCGWASPKVFYPLLFISLATLFYHFLSDYVPRYHALLFTLIWVTTPFTYIYATNSYPHFTVAFYFSVGTFYLYRWIRAQKGSFLLLAGIFLGLSSWVRQVSSIFFLGYLIIVLYVGVTRRRFFAPFFFCALYISISSLWNIYCENVFHFTGGISPPISQSFSFLPEIGRFFSFLRWKGILTFFWKDVLLKSGAVYCLLILTILLYLDRIWKHRFLFLIVLSNLILFLIGLYIAMPTQHIVSSVLRLSIMFFPIIWYFIALITAEPSYLKDGASR